MNTSKLELFELQQQLLDDLIPDDDLDIKIIQHPELGLCIVIEQGGLNGMYLKPGLSKDKIDLSLSFTKRPSIASMTL